MRFNGKLLKRGGTIPMIGEGRLEAKNREFKDLKSLFSYKYSMFRHTAQQQ